MEVTPVVIVRPGVDQASYSMAKCNPGEKVVGGGYTYSGPVSRQSGTVVYRSMPWLSDGWVSVYSTNVDQQTQISKITSYVTCLTVNIALKGTQPSTPPPLPK